MKLILLFFYLLIFQNIFGQGNLKSGKDSILGVGNQVATAVEIVDPIETMPPIADRVRFFYDEAGNQKELLICINCIESRSPIIAEDPLKKLNNDSFILEDFKIYPNPVSEELKIELNDTLKTISTITIYSLSGQLLKKIDDSIIQFPIIIPCSDLPLGIYIVKIKSNDGDEIDFKILKK